MYFNSLRLMHLAHARSHCVCVSIKPTLQRYSAFDATQHLQRNRLYVLNSLRKFTLVTSNYRHHQYISVFVCNSSNIVTFVSNIKRFSFVNGYLIKCISISLYSTSITYVYALTIYCQ